MKATLSLEYIGGNTWDVLRRFEPGSDWPGPFVKKAVAQKQDGTPFFEVIYGKRDYSKANSKGSRGVYVWYILESGWLYYVKEPRSWKSVDFYWCAVTENGDVYKMSESEAQEWLSNL